MDFNSPEFVISVLENSHEAIMACDSDGDSTYFNKKARLVLGLPKNVSLDECSQFYEMYDIDGVTKLKNEESPLIRALTEGCVENLEIILKKNNLPPMILLCNGNALYSVEGKKIGASLTLQDVTELRSATKELNSLNLRLRARVDERTNSLQEVNLALLRSETRFRTIFEQSPLSIQIYSKEGKIILVNPAYKKLWGLNDDFINSYILNKYNILEDPILKSRGVMPSVHRAIAGELSSFPELFYDPREQGFDSPSRWVEAVFYPLKDSDGNVQELVMLQNDVTDRREARDQGLRAEMEQTFLGQVTDILLTSLNYEIVIEQIALAAIPFFADGCLVDLIVDDKIKRIVTKHRQPEIELLMREVQENYPPDINSPQPSGIVLRSGRPELLKTVDKEVIKQRTKDERHARLIEQVGINSHIAVPLKIRGTIIGVLNFLITSDRKPYDDHDLAMSVELARRAAIAINNAKLYKDAQSAIQQRDDFISIASHELKTPLTSLKLQLEVITRAIGKENIPSPESFYIVRASESSHRQLDRLARLVEDMLDISRISTGKLAMNFKLCSFADLVNEVLNRFRDQLNNLKITLHYSEKSVSKIMCDVYRMEQVVTNLMTNAIRYGNRKPIHVKLTSEEGFVYLTVKDFGIGISKGDQARIFNRFERAVTFNDVSGLGLGLFISQQIINDHHGEIFVESALGEGSTFTIKIKESI